ncbi:MAG TPA: outer membrane beta-barrel protein [Mucilaginibacter sp.]|nr:outer membrane beta-barrel protein [Mucilaginibacter sp.]
MRKLILIPLFFLSALCTFAQRKGVVKAVILDSLTHDPVQLATVSILRYSDTSLISYTVTDKAGAFTLHNLREEPSRLLISHVGFKARLIRVDFKKGAVADLGTLYLSARTLQEVVVKGERIPVLVKKDTIEFDAMAFKTRPNAMVIDLLKKLPGVQVNQDGISVMGKPVSKIKVNGKDFFKGDLSVATNNLPAEIISKVQVYDDREDDPDHLQPEYQVKKIINLKFKHNFSKGILSSVGGGPGTQGKYVGAAFAAKFQDDLQLSGRLNADNVSGTQLFFGNSGGFSVVPYSNDGFKKTITGNFDFSKDLGKTAKIHAEYRFNNTIADNGSNTKYQQNISDTIFTSLSKNASHSRLNNQKLYIETEWKPDTLTIIKFVPNVEYTYHSNTTSGNSINSNTYVPLLNTTLSNDHGHNSELLYEHNFNYHRKLNSKGASLTLGNAISVHPENSIDFNANDLTSFIAGFPSDTLRRSAKNTNRDISETITASYHYPLTKKLSADIGFTGLHDMNKGELLTYDEDFKTGLYTIFVQSQSNNLTRRLWGESVAPQLSYNFSSSVYIKIGLNALSQQIGNHFTNDVADLNQNFFYLFPTGELHVKYFTASYSESVQQPSINSLQPITIVYDPLHTFIGNPALKPVYLKNISLNFQKNNFQQGFYFYAGSRLVIEKNTIVNKQTIDAAGGSITTPINGSGRFTTYLNLSASKQLKKRGKWEFGSSVNLNGAIGHNFFIVNGQSGFQNTQNIIFQPSFNIDWNNLLQLTPSYSIDYAVTQYQHVNYPSTSYTSQSAELKADISMPVNFRWFIDYKHTYTPLVSPGFQRSTNLLNAGVSRRIQKNKAEIGLVGYDLLNQNISQHHFVSLNSITDVQNQILRRYILLTYTYHFNKLK